MLLNAHGLLLGEVTASGIYGLLAVYPGRYECGQTARYLLALAPHGAETLYGALGGTGNLSRYVPAAKTLVLAAVALPNFVYDVLVCLHLIAHVSGVPVFARVVQAKPELHSVLLGQAAEHVYQVHRRHIATLLEQIGRRVCDELAITAANVYDGIYAHGLHVAEIPVPLLFSPVLMGNVVRNLIQECARDWKGVCLGNDEGGFHPGIQVNSVFV